MSQSRKRKTYPEIFNGHFFDVIDEGEKGSIRAKCLTCQNILCGNVKPTSNFTSHLQTQHPAVYQLYRTQLTEKKDVKKHKTLNFPVTKVVKLTPLKDKVERLVINYIIKSMCAFSTVEQPEFIALVKGLDPNATLPTRATLMKRISQKYDDSVNSLKSNLNAAKWISTTADLWSNHRRAFVGITVHWIDDNFKRKSSLLTLARFHGHQYSEKIAEKIMEVFVEFGIDQKVIAVTTDNAKNFAKAMREFGAQELYSDSELDSDEELEGQDLADVLMDLHAHYKCASHKFNLITTTDFENGIIACQDRGSSSFKRPYRAALGKCVAYWNKVSRSPLVAEKVTDKTKLSTVTPSATRWNSTYDSIRALLKHLDVIDLCFEEAEISKLSSSEKDFLKDYLKATEPVAWALDKLQGQRNLFFGSLAHYVLKTSKKLKTLIEKENQNVGFIAKLLLNAMNRDDRFQSILSFDFSAARIEFLSAVLTPQIKSIILSQASSEKREELKKLLIEEASQVSLESSISPKKKVSEGNASDDDDDDLSASENEEEEEECNIDSPELECMKYLQDSDKKLQSLEKYPRLKQLFFKHNTPLPSSAPAERVFSIAKLIMRPNRARMLDETFKKVSFLKINTDDEEKNNGDTTTTAANKK